MKEELKPHRLAKKFPVMKEKEFEDLKKDIRDNGQKVPIICFKGRIIDGRNRYRALQDLGIEPLIVEYKGKEEDLEKHIDSLNLERRHLSQAQIACVAALETIAAEDVDKEILDKLGLVRGSKTLSAHKLAQKYEISKRYVESAKKLLREFPEGFKEVFEGRKNFLNVYKTDGETKSKKEYNVKKAVKKQKSLGVIEETDEGYDFSRWLNEAGQKKRDWVKKWKKATRKLFKEIREDEMAFQGSDGELCESLLTS